jgi:hypothetical protein
MPSFRSRNTEATQQAAERRQREDRAPRLMAEVPALEALKLEIQEMRAGNSVPETVHVKHVAVAHAPALFDLPCLDPTCMGGGHDVTSAVLAALRSRSAKFQGEHACNGTTRTAQCTRVLRYIGMATYRAAG